MKKENMKKKLIIVSFIVLICTVGFTQPVNSFLIQAEDFTSYYDTSEGNYDLVYRTDVNVDMNYDHDPYLYEGIRVMAMHEPESLTYTIKVPASYDRWDITFNGIINFNLFFDGECYAENLGTPPNEVGDFLHNRDIKIYDVHLTPGEHTMTIVSNNKENVGEVQLDYIWFTSHENPPEDPPPVADKPYDDTVPPEAPPGYKSPVSEYGELYVDGPNIKSSITGENAPLRFVAISCPRWFPTIKNNTIYNLAYHENVDGIRLAMYAEYQTYDKEAFRPYLQEKILEIINECIDAGIYLEISYHTHAKDFKTQGDDAVAYKVEKEFFTWLLDQDVVKNQQPPNLILGIINEIADNKIPWSEAQPYAQKFVNLIRETLPRNLILCGTPSWCQRPQDVIGNELDGSNIVYTFHMYTAQHEMSIANNIMTCYDAGIPIWANEISPGHYDWEIWSYNFDNFYQLIYILQTRDIPWTNWAWTLKGEALSALYWDSQYAGPWKNSELTEGGRYIRNMINNYLVHTDFSNNSADGWYLNDWRKPAVMEISNEEAHISYDEQSDYTYGQQVTLENIRIINGITYTVSFDARAIVPRNMQVDVTKMDYTMYGSSGPLDITTNMDHYTFSFTMNKATDNNARIVFNVGDSTVDLWLDTITIQYSELGVPEVKKDDVVVLNENFSGECDWDFILCESESAPSAEIEYTNNEAHITFNALAEDPRDQQLSKGITLEQGASYVVRFDARSTAKRPLLVTIGNGDTCESHGSGNFVLSTNMAPYSFRFTMTEQATKNDVIQCNLGTDTHDVWLDNITIIKYNRMLNGDFSLGGSSWKFDSWETPANIEYVNGRAHIAFDTPVTHDYDQQLSNNLRLETGEYYYVSFDACSVAPRLLKVLITNNSYYYTADVALSATMERYEYSFIMEEKATENDRLRFDLGASTNDIWLDNVVVRKAENLIRNGNFSNNSHYWKSGFYNDAAGNAYVVDGEFIVDISDGGTVDWHIQLLQAGVELNKGKRYSVSFNARTDGVRDIIVNIGSGEYSNPEQYTSYSDVHTFSLNADMQTYTFEFTMNESDHSDARLEFNLGMSDYNVILDTICIMEITKISDDFNLKYDSGNWQSNGWNCFWIQLCKKKDTLCGMDIQGAHGAMRLRNGFDAFDAKAVKIDFTYFAKGYGNKRQYNWDLQFTRDGGITWQTVFTWSKWKNLHRCFPWHGCKKLITESVILNAEDYDFTDRCNFRFRSNGRTRKDDVIIDEVEISIYK